MRCNSLLVLRLASILGLVLGAAGCPDAGLVECADGRTCPSELVCDEAHHTCVPPGELDACAGKPQDTPCQTSDVDNGVCREAVCTPIECGNGYPDPGEVCDDGNVDNGDGCRADCMSDETCGNGVLDEGEACDDGNHASHDGCDSTCGTESVAWQEIVQTQNPKVTQAAYAYDSDRGRLVVFGGESGFGPTAITREWDGNAWVQLPMTVSPPASTGAAMAYDAAHHVIVMFGGQTTTGVSSDTWLYDGETWQRSAAAGPPARFLTAMAYDAARKRIVLFGGAGVNKMLGDTWTWDGVRWTQLYPAVTPAAREFATMCYDEHNGNVVMYGGAEGSTVSGATWLWDGAWTRAADGPPRDFAAMSYSPALQAVVLTGGNDGAASSASVLRWDGASWTTDPTPLPAARVTHGSFFDPGRASTVIFGGYSGTSISSEMLSLDDQAAVPSRTAIVGTYSPSPRLGSAMTYDSLRGRIVMFSGGLSGGVNDTWELAGKTWRVGQAQSTNPPPGTPLGSMSAGMAYDEARKVTIVFGGQANDNAVYEWNGTAWSQKVPGGPAPAPRLAPSLAYDRVRGITLMFGGHVKTATTEVFFNDTWAWDGSHWEDLSSGPAPVGRYGHRLAYDGARHTIVLVGGQGATADADTRSVWEWDGMWSAHTITTGPDARKEFGMTYDPALHRTLIHGGSDIKSGVPLADVWAWSGTAWSQIEVPTSPQDAFNNAIAYDPALGGTIAVDGGKTWLLRWQSPEHDDICERAIDTDGDGLAGCADPDCTYTAACQ